MNEIWLVWKLCKIALLLRFWNVERVKVQYPAECKKVVSIPIGNLTSGVLRLYVGIKFLMRSLFEMQLGDFQRRQLAL